MFSSMLLASMLLLPAGTEAPPTPPPPPKCTCSDKCTCGNNCKCAATKTKCQDGCTCAKANEDAGYKWLRHLDGDLKEVALMKGDKQVGGYNFDKKLFLPMVNGCWGQQCEPPIAPPADPKAVPMYVKKATPAPTYYPPTYYAPSFNGGGGCSGGSCGRR